MATLAPTPRTLSPTLATAAPTSATLMPTISTKAPTSKTLTPTRGTSAPTQISTHVPTPITKMTHKDGWRARRCDKKDIDAFISCQRSRFSEYDDFLNHRPKSNRADHDERADHEDDLNFWCRSVPPQIKTTAYCIPPCADENSAFYGTETIRSWCGGLISPRFKQVGCVDTCDTLIDSAVDAKLEAYYESQIGGDDSTSSSIAKNLKATVYPTLMLVLLALSMLFY